MEMGGLAACWMTLFGPVVETFTYILVTPTLAASTLIGLREADLPEILVHDFRAKGYLPEALLNFLALLGWSPGGDRERMSMEEMVELFSIEGIGKSNAKFDRAKLLAFNTEAAAAMPPQKLLERFREYLNSNPDSPLNGRDDETLERILTMKKGFRTLREADEASRFLFVADKEIQFDSTAVEKVLRKGGGAGLNALRDIRAVLQNVEPWRAHEIEEAVKQYCEQKQLGLSNVAQPIRVAISGTTISPPIFQSLEFLGKERTMMKREPPDEEHGDGEREDGVGVTRAEFVGETLRGSFVALRGLNEPNDAL